MNTTIKTKNGNIMSFLTQQYISGTYCIVNNDPSQQFGVTAKEDEFHADIRKKAIKVGDEILSGSFLTVKSKVNLNPFVK